jgi:hypothetical protein
MKVAARMQCVPPFFQKINGWWTHNARNNNKKSKTEKKGEA